MADLSSLAAIPFYGAYAARTQQNEQQGMQDLQQLGTLMQIQKAAQENRMMKEDEARNAAMMAEISAIPPEQRNKATVLPILLKHARNAKEISGFLPDENKGQPIGSGGLRLPSGEIIPPAPRPEIAPKALPTRKRVVGETEIQEEMQSDGTWKEIGRGPRFAKSIIGITDPSKEPLSDEAVRDLAIQSLYDSTVLAGYRRDTAGMARIGNARVKIMKEAGVTSEDVVSGRAGFKADMASLNKITPMYDALTSFEKTAVRNGNMLIQIGDKVDATGVPAIERWVRAGRQATGDPDVAAFNAQLTVYRTEVAKILTNPNLTGQLTDDARREMAEFLRPGASAKQIRAVVPLLERDFKNRRETLEEQIGAIRTRMRGRVGPGAAEQGGVGVSPSRPSAPSQGGWAIRPL